MTAVNQVPQPPLQVPILDANGRMSKPWAIYNRELYNYLAFKGGNAIGGLEEQVETNATNIQTNADNIAQNTTDISTNADNIQTNADDISDLDTELDGHIADETAHGSNGNIVGFNDEATELLFGLVQQMALVSDAATSSESASGNPGAAPAAYDQAYADAQTDLAVSCRNAINGLVSDFNDAVVQLNELIDNSKTSGQMNTT